MKYLTDSLLAVIALAVIGNLIGLAARMLSRARRGKP